MTEGGVYIYIYIYIELNFKKKLNYEDIIFSFISALYVTFIFKLKFWLFLSCKSWFKVYLREL